MPSFALWEVGANSGKKKKRKCYDCIQRNTMQQVEANLPAPISNMSVSLKHSDVS